MPRIFVSSQSVDQSPAKDLIEQLRVLGMTIDHSPRNPADGEDMRWSSWYASGLDRALDSSSLAVLVIDHGWASSSWMAEEARTAFNRLGADAVLLWNPAQIEVSACGMKPYLTSRLPEDLRAAVDEIATRLSSRPRA
jgi:hypothetical protein